MILMGFNGILMGFQWDFMVMLMDLNGILMGFQWDFMVMLMDLTLWLCQNSY